MNISTLSLFLITCFVLLSHNTQAQCHIDDWTALKALYESTDGDNWTNNTNWNKITNAANAADCSLTNVYGLHVNSMGRVTVLELFNNQLKGYLTSQIQQLTFLRELHLQENELAGEIPSTIGNLSSLFLINLYNNNFSGIIPATLGNLPLTYLGLDNNDLSGPIPAQLGNLVLLRDMRLKNNRLSGSIPVEFGGLVSLENLALQANQLTGNIPSELGNLSKLVFLYLNNNKLSGEIPITLTNLENLILLYAYVNQITGEIPTALSLLNKLEYLGLGVNQLTGEIPASLGNLNQLVHLSLDQNNLSGEIPKQLGSLNKLKQMWLWGNNLSGSIPAGFGNLNSIESLDLSLNELSGCFPQNLKSICAKLPARNTISTGNNFDANWESFCASEAGACASIEETNITLLTNYSGNVNLNLTINQANEYLIENQYGQVTNYSICNLANNTSCEAVNNLDNLAANDVLYAIQKASEYFSTTHNVSLPPVSSYVLRNEPNYINGAAFNNLNEVLYFGAGDQVGFKSMTAPDIVAHEFTHYLTWMDASLTDFSNTHEPGALKESFSDIFGEVIERYTYGSNDWVFAKQTTLNSGGIRSLKNPLDPNTQRPTPKYYEGEQWQFFPNYNYIECLNEDRCGIHSNCSVQNYWFYLLSEGGTNAGVTVSGIGMDKAAEIAFQNLKNLNRNATYKDAMFGAILAAKQLYGDNANEVTQTINAWKAVGLDVQQYNPITWQIANETQVGEAFVGADGRERVMMEFDLLIDSLSQDLTADGLTFTLTDQLISGYQFEHIELKAFNPILQPNEVDTISHPNSNDFTVNINRTNSGTAKTKQPYNRIASNTPIGTFVICIMVIDLDSSISQNMKIDILGSTQNAHQQTISFESSSLLFGSKIHNSNEDSGLAQYFLNLQMELTNKNCRKMGNLKFKIMDENQLNVPPYTYYLYDEWGNEIQRETFKGENYGLYSLDEGDYQINIKDSSSSNRQITKNFSIEFRPDAGGSICCSNSLNILPGEVYGTYNAVDSIVINGGTTINSGAFIICD